MVHVRGRGDFALDAHTVRTSIYGLLVWVHRYVYILQMSFVDRLYPRVNSSHLGQCVSLLYRQLSSMNSK